MKRIFEIRINLTKGISYGNEMIFTQGDNQTHYLKIIFEDEINFSGKTMKINFIRPNKTSVFTMITNIGKINEVLVPNNALNIIGDVLIEIVLLEGEKILTVNKLARFVVTETTAGSNLEMIPGNELISEMNNLIVELNRLLTDTDIKKTELTTYTTAKKGELDTYNADKKQELNTHTNIKKTELDKYIVDNRATLKGEKGDTGSNGVLVEAKGMYGFQVRDGHLFLVSTGEETPNFKIENGHLILIL